MILAKMIMSRWLVTGSLVFGLTLSACGGGGGRGPQHPVYSRPTDQASFAEAQNPPNNLSGASLTNARSNIRGGVGYMGATRSDGTNTIASIDTRYDYAHALGFTGNGKKIAFADEMAGPTAFNAHPSLSNKMDTADYYGESAVSTRVEHGYAVASVAVGKDFSDPGIRGIAPDAKVIGLRTDLAKKPQSQDYQAGAYTLAEGVKFAKGQGAIAINNSWGFLYDSVLIDTSDLAEFRAGRMTGSKLVSNYIINNYDSTSKIKDQVKILYEQFVSNNALLSLNSIVNNVAGSPLVGLNTSKDDWVNAVFGLLRDTYTETAIDDYVKALNDFQDQGVVVFSHGNNDKHPESQLVTQFPEFFPELKEAWIAVADASPTQLLSESCFGTAAYCLIAHGDVISANENNAYQFNQGASTAAPQVAGAVAIMAEAFPSLTPKDWTSRLLASGDRSRRYPGDYAIGIVDFGNDVLREIYLKQGHGALDVEAALKPIGPLAIPVSASLPSLSFQPVLSPIPLIPSRSRTQRHSLSNTRFRTSRAFGRGLGARLSQREMAVFDGLNTPFSLNLGTLFSSQDSGSSALLERMSDFKSLIRRQTIALDGKNTMSLMPDAGGRLDGVSFRLSLRDDLSLSMGYGQDRADVFNLHDAYLPPAARAIAADSFGLSYAHLADKGYSVSLAGGKGPGWGVSLFGSDQTVHGPGASQSWGAMGRYGLALSKQAQIEFAVGSLAEQESILGARGEGALAMGAGTTTRFYGLSGRYGLGDGMSLIASYGQGRSSRPREAAGLLLSDFSSTRSDQFSLGLAFEDALSEGDRLSLSLSQPLSVRKSTARLRFPVGRTRAGKVTYEQMQIDFADRRRPLDLGVAWGGTLSDRLSVDAGISLRMKGDDGGRAHDYAPLVLLNMRYRL